MLLWGDWMRKRLLLFILLIIIAFSCGCASCTPGREKSYGVGDTWSYDGVEIKLNSSEYSVDNLKFVLDLKLSFTINATREYQIQEDELYVFTCVDNNIYTETERNEELNGFNIFGKQITSETYYAFCFEVPMESFTDRNNNIINGPWSLFCRISDTAFDLTVDIQV
jgi:hypothetical protein